MEAALKPVGEQIALNSTLFDLALRDVSETESMRRPTPDTNHLKWLAGHVVTGRHHMLRLLGDQSEMPWKNRFEQALPVGLDETTLPSLDEIAAGWHRATRTLIRGLATVSETVLHTSPPSPFPTVENTILAALAFLAAHESYHIGQISYVRRTLGKVGLIEAMLTS